MSPRVHTGTERDQLLFETVAPGLLRINSPLPFRGLKQVNLWLIADGEGWTMVDCGFGSEAVQAQLEAVWAAALGGRPITRLIVTHFHPDHMGNCGWIAERWGVRPWMSTPEWMAAQLAHRDLFTDDVPSSSAFFARHHLPRTLNDAYAEGFLLYSRCVGMPDSYRSLADDEMITIGDHTWRVILGAGHSPALAGLYCDALRVFIAGDQILPKITPNISVVHWEPKGDPLKLYLGSLSHIRTVVPDDVLVLPSHREPFQGLHARIAELEAHHTSRLDFIRELVDNRKILTAADCMKALFGFELDGQQIFFAMGEALAHLNHLSACGEIEATVDGAGFYAYRAIASVQVDKGR
ncbi:MAG: metallo-beta-lactamase superfamily protein [Hyphomicrobiales bacterium]|nr:metallo-beta-lactamase superfamily protein [Hyphomicrobiales bacterium]